MSKISKLHYTGWIPDKWLDALVDAVNSMQTGESGTVDTSEIESLVESLVDSKTASLTATVNELSAKVEALENAASSAE